MQTRKGGGEEGKNSKGGHDDVFFHNNCIVSLSLDSYVVISIL